MSQINGAMKASPSAGPIRVSSRVTGEVDGIVTGFDAELVVVHPLESKGNCLGRTVCKECKRVPSKYLIKIW